MKLSDLKPHESRAGCLVFVLALLLLQTLLFAVYQAVGIASSYSFAHFPIVGLVAMAVLFQSTRYGSRWWVPLLLTCFFVAGAYGGVAKWTQADQDTIGKKLSDEFEKNGFPLTSAFSDYVGKQWDAAKGVEGVITFIIVALVFYMWVFVLAAAVDTMIAPFIYLWGFFSGGVLVDCIVLWGKGLIGATGAAAIAAAVSMPARPNDVEPDSQMGPTPGPAPAEQST